MFSSRLTTRYYVLATHSSQLATQSFPHPSPDDAIGLIKSKSRDSVASTMRKLARKVRRVFDYLCMTENSRPRTLRQAAQVG